MACYDKPIPTELIDKWVNYLPHSRAMLFRKTCVEEANMQTLGTALRPFFATWKTSLMHSSLETLKSISNDDHIRALIEILIIEDDTSRLDPYSSSELPSLHKSYDIWPRNSAGLIITRGGDIVISDLISILREKKLPRLYSLQIRDYMISPYNFRLCDEMLRAEKLLMPKDTQGPVAVASFVRDLLESAAAADTGLLLVSLEIHRAFLPLAEDSVLHSPRFSDSTQTSVLGDPVICEAVLGLASSHRGTQPPATPRPPQEHQQQKLTEQFSMLRTVKLLLGRGDNATTTYWLERICSFSPLRTLELSFRSPLSLAARGERFEAPLRLEEFILRDTTTSTQNILAILYSSKTSLVDLTFRQVTLLDDGSTWASLLSLLSLIAKDFQALASFHLSVLREKARGILAIDYLNLVASGQLDEFRAGLSVTYKGTGINRRVTTVGYQGVEAGFVLGVLAEVGRS